jgi:hypothetical protein
MMIDSTSTIGRFGWPVGAASRSALSIMTLAQTNIRHYQSCSIVREVNHADVSLRRA